MQNSFFVDHISVAASVQDFVLFYGLFVTIYFLITLNLEADFKTSSNI